MKNIVNNNNTSFRNANTIESKNLVKDGNIYNNISIAESSVDTDEFFLFFDNQKRQQNTHPQKNEVVLLDL
jgi:hypothetical protein